MRIVSLVPNATEILFALGAGEDVVGVSHECDYPAEARTRPILTASALDSALDAAQVDAAVSAQVGAGESLYTLDEARIAALEPDLIVTQTLCPVCAVSTAQVDGAVEPLPTCPDVLSLDPQRLEDVFADIRAVAERVGREDAGRELVQALETRIAAAQAAADGRERPGVIALEWLDPPFVAGHWVPEMIQISGGRDLAAQPGDASRRCDWQEIAQLDPDLIVAMPCGFDRAGAADELRKVDPSRVEGMRAFLTGDVYPVDANGLFSRPGPRLVDGIELLAKLVGHSSSCRTALGESN